MNAVVRVLVLFSLVGIAAGCADWDNPTALSDLQPTVEFEFDAVPVETFEEVHIHAHITEGGATLGMRSVHLDVESEATGAVREIEMTPEGNEFEARVVFYDPGEHHIHVIGTPDQHHLSREMGDVEVDVERQHRVIGPYWVEIEVSPGEIPEGSTAHVHLLAFDVNPDGTPGAAVAGLDFELEMHDPHGEVADLHADEENPGEYETEFTFGEAGAYELHAELDVGGTHEDGEFHIIVPAPIQEAAEPTPDPGGGHGH